MSENSENTYQGWTSRLACYTYLVLVASLGLPQIPVHLLGQDVLAPDLLFLLAGALFALSVVFERRMPRWHFICWALLAYIAALLVSAVFSVNHQASLARFPAEVYLVCLAVLTLNIADSPSLLKRSVIAWLVGTVIAVAIGVAAIVIFYIDPSASLIEYITYHYGSVPVGNYPRVSAGFISASMLCNYLNVSFVFTLLAFSRGWLPRIVALGLLGAIAIVSIFTISIGLGGLALAIAFAVPLFSQSRLTRRQIFFAGGAVVSLLFLLGSLFALAPYPEAKVWFQIPLIGNVMPSARVLVWKDAISTFLSRPLTGIGLGKPVANVVFTNTDGSLSLLTDAHNSFLSMAAQSGIIGLAAFASIVVLVLKQWIRAIVDTASPTLIRALGLAFVCAFVYQGLTGSFEDSRHLWIMVGMFLAADRLDTGET